jgi:hypothetical protein
MNIPIEFNLGGVFMPPLLIASIIGLITAMIVAKLLNSYRLSKYFFYPPLAFVSMTVIFTMILGKFLVPF